MDRRENDMTIDEAKALPAVGAYVAIDADQKRKYYALRILQSNPYNLWFYSCNRAGRIARNLMVICVYLGSENRDFLAAMQIVVPNARGWLPRAPRT